MRIDAFFIKIFSMIENIVLDKPIVMVGLMGAGKTSVGRALARRLGIPFVDSDKEIEAAAGCSVVDIFSMYGEADYFGKPGVITRAPEELDTDIDIEQPLFQQPEVSNEPEIPVLDKEPSFIEDKPYKEEGVDFSEITARVRQISGAETAKEYNEYYPEEEDKGEPEAASEQVDFLSEDVPVIEPHSRRIAQEQETAVPETEEEEHDPDSWGTPPKSKEDYAAEPEEVIPAVPEEPKPVPPAAHAPQVHAPVRRTYVPAGSPGMRRVIVRKEEDQEEKPKFRSRFS